MIRVADVPELIDRLMRGTAAQSVSQMATQAVGQWRSAYSIRLATKRIRDRTGTGDKGGNQNLQTEALIE